MNVPDRDLVKRVIQAISLGRQCHQLRQELQSHGHLSFQVLSRYVNVIHLLLTRVAL